MNKRIQELADEATEFCDIRDLTTGEYVNIPFVEKFAEKFAELIVEECMTTVLKESKWYWDKDEFESSNAIQNAARRIKEHFGVEE